MIVCEHLEHHIRSLLRLVSESAHSHAPAPSPQDPRVRSEIRPSLPVCRCSNRHGSASDCGKRSLLSEGVLTYLGAVSVAAACANTLSCFLWALRILLAAAGARWLAWVKLLGTLTVCTVLGAAKASKEWPVARPWILIMPLESKRKAGGGNDVTGAI